MGLCIAFTGGLCFGFFSPAFNIAVNDPWTFSATGLSVAMANIWFSIAFCLASILGNVHLMTNYSSQSTLIPHSTVTAYLTQSCWLERRTALLGGCLCALGNLLQFQGGKLAGFATADLVQAFPLVATVWDVAVFGEFRHATRNVVGILVSMYLAYLAGIALLACSIDY
jgi:glucose uptake protein GlcU